MKIFIDTNVYIDYILEREPFYQAAASVFSYASDGVIEVFVSTLTFTTANFICVDRFKMNRDVMAMKVNGHKNFLNVEPFFGMTFTKRMTIVGRITKTVSNTYARNDAAQTTS